MVSYLWFFTFIVCVLTQTDEMNAQDIKPEDRSIIGNFFRASAELKRTLADEIDDFIGQLKSAVGVGGGSLFANIRQITEKASSGIKNSDEAVKNSLEATKNAAEAGYLAGRVIPKTAVDFANIGIKAIEDLIKNQENSEK